MRIIDADEMAVNESEAYMSVQTSGKVSAITQGLNSVVHRKIQQLIADTPTIDPETLPLVRELRKQLRQTKIELKAMRTAANSLKIHLEAGSKIDIEKSAQNILDRVQQKLGISAEQLMNLVQAYQDGRCVVLPCKVGDPVYWLVDGGVFECYFTLAAAEEVGKTVFLTREAAEAALKGEKQ